MSELKHIPFAYIGAFYEGDSLQNFLEDSLGPDYSKYFGDVESMTELYIAENEKILGDSPDLWVFNANNLEINKIPGWFIGCDLQSMSESSSMKRNLIDVRNVLTSIQLITHDQEPGTVELVLDILKIAS